MNLDTLATRERINGRGYKSGNEADVFAHAPQTAQDRPGYRATVKAKYNRRSRRDTRALLRASR